MVKKGNQKLQKTIRLDEIHWGLIRGLTPFYGSNEVEVIRTLLIMWLDQNIGSDAIKKLEELGAVTLKNEIGDTGSGQ